MSCVVSLKLDLRYDGEAGGTRQTDQNMEQKVRTGHLTADTTTDPTIPSTTTVEHDADLPSEERRVTPILIVSPTEMKP